MRVSRRVPGAWWTASTTATGSSASQAGGAGRPLSRRRPNNGNWIIRFASGEVQEGPIVDGEQNGNWVIRFADGNSWKALREWREARSLDLA